MKKLICVLLIVFTSCKATAHQTSVIIIGGGPAGLAAAIEAKLTGAEPTVVEKRSDYERGQLLFLFDHSLELLNKWGVKSPELSVIEIGDKRRGFVKISDLEKALLKRAKEMGIVCLQDKFVSIEKGSLILEERGALPYDILIGADGQKSLVRKLLGIEVDLLGQGKAGAAFFPASVGAPINPIEALPDTQHGSSFIRKFQFPEITFIFLQGPLSANQEDFITLSNASGWGSLAERVKAGDGVFLFDVDVTLQKAKRFSLKEENAIIIGDAAGTGSFVRGRGANHALETAEIAGHFFKTGDYELFEEEMAKATGALIEDSAFLFNS